MYGHLQRDRRSHNLCGNEVVPDIVVDLDDSDYVINRERGQGEPHAQDINFKRGPRIPLEIVKSILSIIPSINRITLKREDDLNVYVDGLLPYTVVSPSLSLPHFESRISSACTLLYFDNEDIKPTVLEEASLINRIKLRVLLRDDKYPMGEHASDLLPLQVFPHRLKQLHVDVKSFSLHNFIRLFESCFSRLEGLAVYIRGRSESETVPGVSNPLSSDTLKKASLDFTVFTAFFDTGALRNISSLTLEYLHEGRFQDYDSFKNVINNLPRMLSQLSHLERLSIKKISCKRNELDGLPKVNSASLRYLYIGGSGVPALCSLFSDCRINCIDVDAEVLQGLTRFFPGTSDLRIRNSFPKVLIESVHDGRLVFPKLERITLWQMKDDSEQGVLQIQDSLLKFINSRNSDVTVRSIKYMRIPREIVTSVQFQEELEKYISSLVILVPERELNMPNYLF